MTEINLNKITLNYKLEGNGKTIVFVHGLSDSLDYWNVLTSQLKNEYQTLSFDLRGHGNSSDDDEKTSINTYQNDLYQLLKALDIDHALFVGLSLGGNIILDLAVKHPEMVDGLVVMSSFSEHDERLENIFNEFKIAIDKGFIEFYDTILPYTLTEEMIDEHREVLEDIKYRVAPIANIEGIKKGIEAGYGFDITDKLKDIDVPSVVIAGEKDDLTDLNIQKKISDNIKDCELIVLENTKHNVLIGENVTRILEIINELMLKID